MFQVWDGNRFSQKIFTVSSSFVSVLWYGLMTSRYECIKMVRPYLERGWGINNTFQKKKLVSVLGLFIYDNWKSVPFFNISKGKYSISRLWWRNRRSEWPYRVSCWVLCLLCVNEVSYPQFQFLLWFLEFSSIKTTFFQLS